MADNPHYGRAPILEAIIELRFNGDPLSERDFERLQNRFKGEYPSIEERREISVEMAPNNAVVTHAVPSGFKMTAKNAVDVVLLMKKEFFASTRLGSYDRWETFQAKAKDNFDAFTKIVGRKKITRIGVRYLNRFDIPVKDLNGQPLNKFLKIGVAIPTAIMKTIGNFGISVTGVETSTGAGFTLSCGTSPPALLEHASIGLDIDVYWDREDKIPGRIEEVWATTDVLREAKNHVFETSITDSLRAIIQ